MLFLRKDISVVISKLKISPINQIHLLLRRKRKRSKKQKMVSQIRARKRI